MQNNFLESYINCITRMDLTSIKPCVEGEIQPLYSDIWVSEVIQKRLLLDSFDPINPSVLRSMLVMDLYDCHFASRPDLKIPVYQWYQKQLMKYYSEDPFSLTKNIISVDYKFDDFLFFDSDEESRVLLLEFFALMYEKYLDIFADNGYEILGPYYTRSGTYVINRFHGVQSDVVYDFIQYSRGRIPGCIDMFGHSDLSLDKILLTINGEISYENHTQLAEFIRTQTLWYQKSPWREKYLNSRLVRERSMNLDIVPLCEKIRRRLVDAPCTFDRTVSNMASCIQF